MSEMLQVLIIAYAAVGVIAAVGYIPTIKDLWLHRKMSANINSYVIWTLCSAITFLYSMLILDDMLFRIVSGLNVLCSSLILVLRVFLEYSGKTHLCRFKIFK